MAHSDKLHDLLERLDKIREAPQSVHDILQAFPQEVNAFKTDPDFDILDHEEFYEALFNMYLDSGEMPYGTAKARTGDPAQWITDKLHMEFTRPERQRNDIGPNPSKYANVPGREYDADDEEEARAMAKKDKEDERRAWGRSKESKDTNEAPEDLFVDLEQDLSDIESLATQITDADIDTLQRYPDSNDDWANQIKDIVQKIKLNIQPNEGIPSYKK